MKRVHLCEKIFTGLSIHFDVRVKPSQLTNDPKQVTCKRCLAMIKHQKNKKEV